jgi:hypothetical protein
VRNSTYKKDLGFCYSPQDNNLPPAIICDLDGTLAIIGKRSPFEDMHCEGDELNEPVAEILDTYFKKGDSIILMSGRMDRSKEPTERWLTKHGIRFHHLYMRKTNDMRKDAVIKKELFEKHIKNKYFVRFVLDDRNQVVDLWRKDLGLPCLQVNYGDF